MQIPINILNISRFLQSIIYTYLCTARIGSGKQNFFPIILIQKIYPL